ncbi:MAG: type II toxin-antitoxin system RatA family toxin [Hyphomicrobium sp.]
MIREILHKLMFTGTAVGLCSLCVFAPKTWAMTPDMVAKLTAGESIVSVKPSQSPADGEVRATIDVPAPAPVIYGALTECERAPEVFPSVKSCRVLELGPGATWDVRTHTIASWASFLPDMSIVFRSNYTKNVHITFKLVSGDLEYLEGEWVLEPLPDTAVTRVYYRASVGFHPLIPAFLVRQSLQKDVPRFLASIKEEAVRRVANGLTGSPP